jgi:ABC-2 type transport system ATP-binding protein
MVHPLMIEARGLVKSFGSAPAVAGLDLSVPAGTTTCLVGPNGAGKTTTLRVMAGIIPPTRGNVRIGGHDIAAEPIQAKQLLAFFPDEPRLFDYLTVRQHLAFVARLYGVLDHEARSMPLLEELEIADRADHLPGELSRGMKQKLAIACGLLHSPSVMIFDEPLTGLDPLGIRRMKDSILRRAKEGAAIVLSSHLLHLLEEVCSHVLILKNGESIAYDTMAAVHARFSNGDPGASLEDVFIRATGGSET